MIQFHPNIAGLVHAIILVQFSIQFDLLKPVSLFISEILKCVYLVIGRSQLNKCNFFVPYETTVLVFC